MKETAVIIYLARKGKAPVLAAACKVSSLQWWQLAFLGRVGDSKASIEGQVAACCMQTTTALVELAIVGYMGCCICFVPL